MKKQFFLLSLLLAAFNVSGLVAKCDTACDTKCATSCATSCDTKCDTCCVPEHGHTFMSNAVEFSAASPERVALFESKKLANLKQDDKHGAVQVSVFGGRTTKGRRAAGYYLPYGHTTLNFDGSNKVGSFASVLAQSDVLAATAAPINDELTVYGNYSGTGNTSLAVDPATFKFDMNKDTSIVLPWNFGITYAALYEPRGASANGATVGTGLVTAPAFKSQIAPCLRRWHVGAGVEVAYHFSEEVDGWFVKASTAVQHVRSRISLNETVATEKEVIANLPAGLPYGNATGNFEPKVNGAVATDFTLNIAGNPKTGVATTTPVGSIKESYSSTTFPTSIDNVTQAFAQDAWNYGKIGCEQRITRLADIELSFGRQWTCGDCAATTWDFGVVIPTGNRACPEFVAPAVVGNNRHFGIRMGSTTSFMLSECDTRSTWFRMDVDSRYLFRNTQRRSFDLKGNEWSRYMMVWESKEAYTSALTAFAEPFTAGDGLPQRGYTPGINVFTTDFRIKPQFQGRLNSALVMAGERFQAELGWNLHARTKECVELACDWEAKAAFADASYTSGLGLNNNRTIYNDSQTTVVGGIDSLTANFTMAGLPLADVGALTPPLVNVLPTSTKAANVAAAANVYDNCVITADQINLDSVAAAASLTHKPYVNLAYAFDCGWAPTIAAGASYEFAANNSALSQWMVWGKFAFAF